MKTKFKELFEKYGYKVEQISEDSFIADNGIFYIPYTEYHLLTQSSSNLYQSGRALVINDLRLKWQGT